MRVNCRPPRRLFMGQIALAAVAASLVFAGCQTPPFDHVDGASTGFNANHMPTADQHDAPTPGSQSETTIAAESETKSSVTPQVGSNEALIVENLNLGHREAALNRLEQAEAYYRRVLEIQPENSVANHRLAVIADKKHDYARAEHFYLTALHREPRNPDLLSDLGYSYLLQGRREESERCLMAATRLDPSHGKALHNLSLLYAANGDYDRSFDALRRSDGESEARIKIATLFPKGRPQASDKEAVVASFQPMDSSDGRAPAAVDAADSTSAASQPPATAAGSTPQTSSSRTSGGRLPDSEINNRFAAIDRESAPVSATTSSTSAPTTSAPQTAMVANGPTPAQAAPSADPLASMPLWSPGESSLQTGKPPSAFEFDAQQPAPAQGPPPQRPRVVATDITPAEDNSKSPTILSRRDALSAFDAELQREKVAAGGRTDSNGAAARDPLIVDRTQEIRADADDPSKPAANASNPAPFNSVSPIRIQPRSNPAPLFEPLDDFGPGNDFAPSEKVAVPAWPGTNGGTAAPAGNSSDAGPIIRPGSPN
jgi:cytochrome c-type biogenesis protein CcmH/NrfG